MNMVMHWVWTAILTLSVIFSLLNHRGAELAAAVFRGAQAGATLAISLAGSICLWSGVGKLMTHLGLTDSLSRLLRPILHAVFPDTRRDSRPAGTLSANICANLLGLGNAATPMGIEAAKRLRDPSKPAYSTDSLCRLIVLNTASIQLIPTNVAAVRLNLGCATPFDILPAVWIASFTSAGLGLLAAVLLGRVWKT
jgi:spore maturation protein A